MKERMPFLLLIIFSLTTCKKADLNSIDNLNNGKIDIIAHGGGGFQSLIQPLPTNSFTNIKNAIDGLNADGMEIDVKVTSDSVVVLYHDNILETSTNCSGCPENFTSSEILGCKYKNYYGSRAFNEENLLSFQTLIDYFKGREKLPHIYTSLKLPTECSKDNVSMNQRYINAIARIIKDNNAYSWISVSNGYPHLLKMFKSTDPQIDLIFDGKIFDDAINAAISNDFSGIIMKVEDITKEQVKLAHSYNKKITLWGVMNKDKVLDAIEKNPDAIMSDNLPLTIDVLRQK